MLHKLDSSSSSQPVKSGSQTISFSNSSKTRGGVNPMWLKLVRPWILAVGFALAVFLLRPALQNNHIVVNTQAMAQGQIITANNVSTSSNPGKPAFQIDLRGIQYPLAEDVYVEDGEIGVINKVGSPVPIENIEFETALLVTELGTNNGINGNDYYYFDSINCINERENFYVMANLAEFPARVRAPQPVNPPLSESEFTAPTWRTFCSLGLNEIEGGGTKWMKRIPFKLTELKNGSLTKTINIGMGDGVFVSLGNNKYSQVWIKNTDPITFEVKYKITTISQNFKITNFVPGQKVIPGIQTVGVKITNSSSVTRTWECNLNGEIFTPTLGISQTQDFTKNAFVDKRIDLGCQDTYGYPSSILFVPLTHYVIGLNLTAPSVTPTHVGEVVTTSLILKNSGEVTLSLVEGKVLSAGETTPLTITFTPKLTDFKAGGMTQTLVVTGKASGQLITATTQVVAKVPGVDVQVATIVVAPSTITPATGSLVLSSLGYSQTIGITETTILVTFPFTPFTTSLVLDGDRNGWDSSFYCPQAIKFGILNQCQLTLTSTARAGMGLGVELVASDNNLPGVFSFTFSITNAGEYPYMGNFEGDSSSLAIGEIWEGSFTRTITQTTAFTFAAVGIIDGKELVSRTVYLTVPVLQPTLGFTLTAPSVVPVSTTPFSITAELGNPNTVTMTVEGLGFPITLEAGGEISQVLENITPTFVGVISRTYKIETCWGVAYCTSEKKSITILVFAPVTIISDSNGVFTITNSTALTTTWSVGGQSGISGTVVITTPGTHEIVITQTFPGGGMLTSTHLVTVPAWFELERVGESYRDELWSGFNFQGQIISPTYTVQSFIIKNYEILDIGKSWKIAQDSTCQNNGKKVVTVTTMTNCHLLLSFVPLPSITHTIISRTLLITNNGNIGVKVEVNWGITQTLVYLKPEQSQTFTIPASISGTVNIVVTDGDGNPITGEDGNPITFPPVEIPEPDNGGGGDNPGGGGTPDDLDGDGVQNGQDNCKMVSNPNQTDDDHNGIGNECQKGIYLPIIVR